MTNKCFICYSQKDLQDSEVEVMTAINQATKLKIKVCAKCDKQMNDMEGVEDGQVD